MEKVIWFVGLIIFTNVSNAYEDRASSQIKRHMLVELYQQIDIHQIISSIEGHALMPAISFLRLSRSAGAFGLIWKMTSSRGWLPVLQTVRPGIR